MNKYTTAVPPRGKPPLRWINHVEGDLLSLGISNLTFKAQILFLSEHFLIPKYLKTEVHCKINILKLQLLFLLFT